jgi:hypothetical protein
MKEKNTTSVLETASKTGGGHRTEKQMTVGKSSFRFLVRRAAAAARVPVSDFLINFAGINTNVFIFCVSARFLPGARGGEKEREREREKKRANDNDVVSVSVASFVSRRADDPDAVFRADRVSPFFFFYYPRDVLAARHPRNTIPCGIYFGRLQTVTQREKEMDAQLSKTGYTDERAAL